MSGECEKCHEHSLDCQCVNKNNINNMTTPIDINEEYTELGRIINDYISNKKWTGKDAFVFFCFAFCDMIEGRNIDEKSLDSFFNLLKRLNLS